MAEDKKIKLKVKRITEGAVLPCYAHEGDAGMDLFSAVELEIPPGQTRLVGTGLAIELPPGYEAQVRPKSGIALAHSVTVLNTPGTVDSAYRGEVGVILINHGSGPYRVGRGKKIAQMVVKPVEVVEVSEVGELGASRRGEGGFGSTGLG